MQNLTEPDPLRLKYRETIKQTIHDVVLNTQDDALMLIQKRVNTQADMSDKENVQALIIEELRRLHEGILVRYDLRISEFQRWKKSKRVGGQA